MYKQMKHNAQTGLVSFFIGILIAVIVAVGVALPVVQDTIDNSSVTGTAQTILTYIPVLLVLVLLVAIASAIRT